MNGCNYLSGKSSAGDNSALLCDLEMSSDQRASCGGSKENYNAGLDLLYFSNEPWFTTGDFIKIRALVKSLLSARDKLKMLYRIGEIALFYFDSDFSKKMIEKFSSWADKGPTEKVFLVAWLLTHNHDFGISWTFP